MSTSKKKEFSIIIDGQTYQVKVEELAGGELEVELDGKTHRVSMAEVASMESPPAPARSAKPAVPAPAVPTPGPERMGTGGTGSLHAPMPGDIVQILVQVGDRVNPGQEVCVLEAMKMKNMLRASRPGVVKSIEVSIGQSVNYGDVLIRFDS